MIKFSELHDFLRRFAQRGPALGAPFMIPSIEGPLSFGVVNPIYPHFPSGDYVYNQIYYYYQTYQKHIYFIYQKQKTFAFLTCAIFLFNMCTLVGSVERCDTCSQLKTISFHHRWPKALDQMH